MEASLALFNEPARPSPLFDGSAPIKITVYGAPQPAGSKTPGQTKTGKLFVRDSAKRSRPWKDAITQAAGEVMQGREMVRGAVVLTATFYRARPKGHFGKRGLKAGAPLCPITKPDLTKYVRAAEDALRGVVWKDDSQVVRQVNEKVYGEPERVELEVLEL